MNHQNQKKEQPRKDRSGMSTVEFALLLPLFALSAAAVMSLGHLFYRTVCQSHAAFSAARRCAVSGSAARAFVYVRRDYTACSMPETPAVAAGYADGTPGVCRVQVSDRIPFLEPLANGRISARLRAGATITATAAGTSAPMGGDND